mmetsp:Transcript_10854/g.15901  ORF Transcript_10854/g.15901 Transcript_10854/m.15901 type:complete len:289 (+) Transcript_10854:506-1372(+)
MRSFKTEFGDLIRAGVIDQITPSMGPASELRYPSYPEQQKDNHVIWSYPGIGEFQCYDKYMLENLEKAAQQAGHPEWGHGGPNNAGYYNSKPYETAFFSDNQQDNYNSEYGKFFLNWYSNQIVDHGDRILYRATTVFNDTNVHLAAKISGLHWWFDSTSHAIENTAGYYDTRQYNGYEKLAAMMQKYNVEFAFTCFELPKGDFDSDPEGLITLTGGTARRYNIRYGGENALPIYGDHGKYDTMVYRSCLSGKPLDSFTFLRLNDGLINDPHQFGEFQAFTDRMAHLTC